MRGCELAIQLGGLLEDGRVLDPRASRSLLVAWSSDEGWTSAQARLAARLIHEATPQEGHERAVAPFAYTMGGPWYRDTRPERQALRGRKSGIVRRWRTRERDRRIRRLRDDGLSLAEIGEIVGLAKSTVHHILTRVVSDPLPRLAAVRRTIVNMQVRIPDAVLERVPGRTTSVFKSLLAWCGLEVVRDLPDSAVRSQARRLNDALDRPLRGRRLDDTVRRVLRDRRRWA